MNNQVLVVSIIVICSLAGWYVVLSKYLELKAMLKIRERQDQQLRQPALQTLDSATADTGSFSQPALYNPTKPFDDREYDHSEHIPGLGPPPLVNMPFSIPPEVIAHLRKETINSNNIQLEDKPTMETHKKTTIAAQEAELDRRSICNWASILHLSGLSLVTGLPFVNIIVPAIFWLMKKEQHSYLAKQGREVINFQITLTLIQFLCLGLGSLFVWLMPQTAAGLFAWTRTVRVIFSTGMLLPCNIFSALPFFWGCIMMVRGAVAAYHGLAFKYPYSQQFLFETKTLGPKIQANQTATRKDPEIQPAAAAAVKTRKVSFG
jgi:uncharacterized Tic20 family protein